MFVRIKKSGKYKYLQVVENRRAWGRSQQFVIGNMGRLDKYEKGEKLSQVIISLTNLQWKIRASADSGKSPKKRTRRKP